jgi:hypothetical protein
MKSLQMSQVRDRAYKQRVFRNSDHDCIMTTTRNQSAILKVGLPRSGNVWLTNILKRTLRLSTRGYRMFLETMPAYYSLQRNSRGSDQYVYDEISIRDGRCYLVVFGGPKKLFIEEIEDVGKYAESSSLVWTHSPCDEVSLPFFLHFSKTIYLVRDPRSLIESRGHWEARPAHGGIPRPVQARMIEDYRSWVQEWTDHVASALRYRDQLSIHLVFYERLIADFDQEFDRLLRYLELEISEDDRERIRMQTSFENMKKNDSHQHMHRGSLDSWKDNLPEDMLLEIERMTAPLLQLFGYPFHNEEIERKLPAIRATGTKANIDGAIGRLADLSRGLVHGQTKSSWIRSLLGVWSDSRAGDK